MRKSNKPLAARNLPVRNLPLRNLPVLLVCSTALAAVLCVAPHVSGADAPSAEELLAKSIAYHDPEGVWGEAAVRVTIQGELSDELAARSGARTTERRAVIDPRTGRFDVAFEESGAEVKMTVVGDEATVTVDGRSDLSAEELEKYRATVPRALLLRNYMSYLYGLPMKLRDAGVNLDPTPERTTFQGEDVWALRVTYDEAVGRDTWYFYLDPETAALVGYRFYHDEDAGDGEYIVLDGEIEGGGLRLPKVRRWYTNQEGTYLATDTVAELEVLEP